MTVSDVTPTVVVEPDPERADRLARGRVLALTGFLVLLADPLSLWLAVRQPIVLDEQTAGVMVVLLVLFIAGELWTVDIEFRRESHTFSFSSVPLVIGIFTTSAALVILLRVLASMIVLLLMKRQPLFKLVVNLTSHVIEVAVAATAVALIAPGDNTFSIGAWLVAGFAVMLADFVGALVITGAISAFQGEWEPSLLGGVWMGMVVAIIDVTIAILVITLHRSQDAAVVLVFVVAAFVVVVARAYAQMSGRYHGLELLDRFTRALGEAVYEGSVVARLLREAGEILHAEHVWLVVRDGEGLRHVGLLDQELVVGEPSPLDAAILDGVTDAAVLSGLDDERFPELESAGYFEMIAVRLAAREGEELALVVADRSGGVRPFDEKDSQLFETLAVHAGLALQNVGLVSQLRNEVEVTEHLATHDVLTELPNRSLFHQRLQASLHDPDRDNELAVLLIDLDRFKDVNDTLGHHNGDHLLAEVGRRLRAALDGTDLIARLGGDEFAVLLYQTPTPQQAVAVGEQLVSELQRPFTIADVEVDVGASIGVAMSSETIKDAATLLRQADVAMYTAKADHSGVEVYSPDRDHYSPKRLALVGRLRSTIEKGELALVYQPQVDLGTMRVRGVEALVRWPQPGLSPIPPDEFIYVAEHTGLIRPLTRWVLQDAITQAARWYRDGRNLRVSVNLSPHNMIERGLPAEIADMLGAADLPPEMLMIELTETTVMSNPGRTVEIMNTLREIGVSIAIDDFGTGHSSLAYLTGLPATELKIDKSFVFAMGTDPAADTVVKAIVDLGRNLGLEVVAEGVETEFAALALQEMHCAVAQGYLYSRPVDPRSFEHWLANYDAMLDESNRSGAAVSIGP